MVVLAWMVVVVFAYLLANYEHKAAGRREEEKEKHLKKMDYRWKYYMLHHK